MLSKAVFSRPELSNEVRSKLAFVLLGHLMLAGCAQIVGANFDVELAKGNGGSGGHAAGGAGGATPKTILATDDFPFDIEVDDTFVYWTAWGATPGHNVGGAVRRTRKDGSGPVETIAPGLADPNRLTLDDTFVYWTNTGTAEVKGSVMRAPKAGGNAEVLASDIVFPIGIVVDRSAGFVYFTTHEQTIPTQDIVYRIDVGSKPPGSKTPFAYVPQGAAILALQSTALWGTSDSSGIVWNVPKQDALSVPVVNPLPLTGIAIPSVNAIAAVEGRLVVNSLGATDGYVWSIKPPGGATKVSPCTVGCADVALDASHAYWADGFTGEVSRAPPDGGPAERIAKVPSVNGVTVDADFVYYAQYTLGGVVGRAPKIPSP